MFKSSVRKKVEGDSGGFGLYILAQTGFVKSGSDLECLHASVGEKRQKMCEKSKGSFSFFFLLVFFFCLMAVLLSEAQTEIPHKSQESYLPAIALGGVILNVRVHPCGVGKRSHSHHAHPPCSVAGTHLNNPPAVSLSLWVGGISVWALGLLCAVHL